MTVLTRQKVFSPSQNTEHTHIICLKNADFHAAKVMFLRQVPQAWPPVILPEDLGEGALSEVQLATAVFGQQHS